MESRNIVKSETIGPDGKDATPLGARTSPFDTPETHEQAEEGGPDSAWKFWRDQLRAGISNEHRWRIEAEASEELYFGPDEDPGRYSAEPASERRNEVSEKAALIHSTIDVLRPLVYSKTPTPIVRRRFRGDGKAPSPEERLSAEVAQRIASYLIDDDCFDEAVRSARDDWLIAGRGQVRVRYGADVQDVEVDGEQAEAARALAEAQGIEMPEDALTVPAKASETVKAYHVEWRRFVTAPGHGWDDAPWVAYEIPMTRTKVAERFSEDVAAQVSYNEIGLTQQPFANTNGVEGLGDILDDETSTKARSHSPFDTASIWEIWNRDSGEVIWFCDGYKEGLLGEEEDALELADFFPSPRPLTATTKGNSLLPRPDIRYYARRADEIEIASRKMHTILQAISVSGLYPGAMEKDVKKLLSGNNEMIGIQDWIGLMEKGGAGNIIQWLPLANMIQALEALAVMREQAKAAMFEQSGVSDVMRAQGDPTETATAQQIKGRYAGLRMKERQSRMAMFVRETIEIMVELAVENFEPEYLHQISGLSIPLTEMERQLIEAQNQQTVAKFQQLQQMHQALMQTGQQVPPPPEPKLQDVPETSFERVLEVLRNDLRRQITINIETDSTVLADEQADKEARIEFLSAFSSFVQQMAPLLQSGQFDMKVVKELLVFGVRGFPQSRTLEGMIGEMPDKMEGAPGQQKDPSIQVAEIKAQVDMEIEKMRQANEEKDRQHELRLKGVDTMVKTAEMENNAPPPPKPPVQQHRTEGDQ